LVNGSLGFVIEKVVLRGVAKLRPMMWRRHLACERDTEPAIASRSRRGYR